MRGRIVGLIVLASLIVAGGCGYRLVPVENSSPSPSPGRSGPVESRAPSPGTTPASGALPSTQRRVASGVVRLEASTCSRTVSGSGFAVDKNFVVTSAQLVDGAATVRVIAGKNSQAGRVVGIDRNADVALIRLTTPATGYRFRFAPDSPELGETVGGLAFAPGAPLHFGSGTITEVDKSEDVGGTTRYGLIQIGGQMDSGSSGGALFDEKGAALGLIIAGPEWDPARILAISRDVVAPLVSRWRGNPDPRPRAECSALVNAETNSAPEQNYSADEVQAAGTLDLYFRSITNADYATALAQFADGEERDLKKYVASMSTTKVSDVKFQEVRSEDDTPVIWVTYISEQAAGDGPEDRPEETCTRWSQDYSFTEHDGLWLIDDTEAHRGNSESQPC